MSKSQIDLPVRTLVVAASPTRGFEPRFLQKEFANPNPYTKRRQKIGRDKTQISNFNSGTRRENDESFRQTGHRGQATPRDAGLHERAETQNNGQSARPGGGSMGPSALDREIETTRSCVPGRQISRGKLLVEEAGA